MVGGHHLPTPQLLGAAYGALPLGAYYTSIIEPPSEMSGYGSAFTTVAIILFGHAMCYLPTVYPNYY